jgi:ribonuclease T2
MQIKGLIVSLSLLLFASTVQAVNVEGTFTAIKSCPAYKSFNKGQNPGDIYTVPGRTYQVVEENKPRGPWALILVPEISDGRRWVAKECGTTAIKNSPEEPKGNNNKQSGNKNCSTAGTYDSFVLALSWQAGFCEHYRYSGSKPECDTLNAGHIAVTNITIHGLWPNKSGCGTNYGDCTNTPLHLREDTISQISPWMPNWYYSSDFGNHEWSKHGTCQKLSADDYFLLMQRLAEKFDGSPLGLFIRDNMGHEMPVADMENYLDANLGAEVTKKMELRCTGDGNRFVNEFWINLPGEIRENGGLAELVDGAKEKPKFRGNCAERIYIEVPGPN